MYRVPGNADFLHGTAIIYMHFDLAVTGVYEIWFLFSFDALFSFFFTFTQRLLLFYPNCRSSAERAAQSSEEG